MSSEQEPSLRQRFESLSAKQKPESFWQSFIRKDLQKAARIGETIVGMPGNLKKAFMQTRDYFAPELKEYEKSLGQEEPSAFMRPPTTPEIREKVTKPLSESITGNKEYLEPKNEMEKFEGDVSEDLATFFMPGSNRLRFAVKLGAPIVGNLSKEGLKYLGADEETATKAKNGIMLASTIAGQSNPGKFAGERIQQAKQMIPDTATVDVANLANRLLSLYNRMTRGLGVPSKSRAIQGMKDLAGQVQNNRLNFKSLMDARDNVNEWISEAGGWDVPTQIRDPMLHNLNELKKSIIKTIDENMQTRFPQVNELYKSGYEAAAVNHRSNAISNFIEKNFGRKASSVGIKILFPSLAGGSALVGGPKALLAAAATVPLYKSGQVLYRVANSPTLARYYQDVITHSVQGNAPAMIKSMTKLDKELSKQENKEKNISIDEFKKRFRSSQE